mmetsp:Transcript_83670/g.175004  ORF Transcript_83670/g.175004 Transcript_83670/m.175004 type:complete len:398 (+) Transcript_83670:1980-3173(+)
MDDAAVEELLAPFVLAVQALLVSVLAPFQLSLQFALSSLNLLYPGLHVLEHVLAFGEQGGVDCPELSGPLVHEPLRRHRGVPKLLDCLLDSLFAGRKRVEGHEEVGALISVQGDPTLLLVLIGPDLHTHQPSRRILLGIFQRLKDLVELHLSDRLGTAFNSQRLRHGDIRDDVVLSLEGIQKLRLVDLTLLLGVQRCEDGLGLLLAEQGFASFLHFGHALQVLDELSLRRGVRALRDECEEFFLGLAQGGGMLFECPDDLVEPGVGDEGGPFLGQQRGGGQLRVFELLFEAFLMLLRVLHQPLSDEAELLVSKLLLLLMQVLLGGLHLDGDLHQLCLHLFWALACQLPNLALLLEHHRLQLFDASSSVALSGSGTLAGLFHLVGGDVAAFHHGVCHL